MKIFRTIWVKDLEDIDLTNFGNHWSTFEFSIIRFNQALALQNEKEEDYIKVWINAEIEENQINTDNNELANNCDTEYEIITSFNTDIFVNIATEEDIIYEGIVNTGSRYQKIAC